MSSTHALIDVLKQELRGTMWQLGCPTLGDLHNFLYTPEQQTS